MSHSSFFIIIIIAVSSFFLISFMIKFRFKNWLYKSEVLQIISLIFIDDIYLSKNFKENSNVHCIKNEMGTEPLYGIFFFLFLDLFSWFGFPTHKVKRNSFPWNFVFSWVTSDNWFALSKSRYCTLTLGKNMCTYLLLL